jgi:hypothetical protein
MALAAHRTVMRATANNARFLDEKEAMRSGPARLLPQT